jgi:hypothetical protein
MGDMADQYDAIYEEELKELIEEDEDNWPEDGHLPKFLKHTMAEDFMTTQHTDEMRPLLQEAATMLERYRDQLLVHSEDRPKSKEINDLLKRIYAS